MACAPETELQSHYFCAELPRQLDEYVWFDETREEKMPELPDVEIFKQYLDATSLYKTIETVDIKDKGMLKGVSEKKLKQLILSRSRGPIKTALMNQNMIAGLGNVYVDEILFQAGVHPKANAKGLKEETIGALFHVMRDDVLPTAIERRADPSRFPDDYIIPHREKDARCPKCGDTLQQVKVSGRTTYLCPDCQRR